MDPNDIRRIRFSRRTGAAVLGLVLGLGLPLGVLGQQQLTPNYRGTDLLQVVEAVGAVTGRNILVDPRVRGEVNLISNTPMTPEAFYEAFLATLAVQGFVAMESDGLVRILPDPNARTIAGTDTGEHAEDFVTRVIPLRNVAAAQLVPILRPMAPQSAYMVGHQQSNVLIMADRANNIARLERVVQRMDQLGSEDFEIITLENASAADIARMLAPMAQQMAQAAGGTPPVQMVADERTNSVVLSGNDSGRLRFRGLIAHLDTPTDQGGETRVRYLYYANAETLAERLQAQFGTSPEAEAEGGISIWADPSTNALVYNAPARIAQDMMAVVDRLDIRRAQVQVDAIIVEVSESKAAELGITWAIQGSGDNAPIGLTNFGGTVPGIVDLAAAAAGDIPSPAAIPQGITAGVGRIRDGATSWAALVTALRGDSSTNIISTPTIVTMDNEEAEISVGQQVPFLTGQYSSTGAAPGVGVIPFQTIQREEVGTSLRITPQVNEGDGVKLIIEQEASSIAAITGAVDIVTNRRAITTSVFVDDGDILVLGGLMDDQLTQGEQRVPGLGRIPGLGWLFRARSTDRTKTNLMVFIRPVILRDSAQAVFQTNARYNYIRDMQLEQAQQPVRLMREEPIPILPALPLPPAGQPTAQPPVIDLRRDAEEEEEDDGGEP